MDAIYTDHLTKTFDTITAVDNISLSIEQGELFGLLGPNGAGKTTTIKMLSTLLSPTSGSARVWGHDIRHERDEVRRSIGMVFQDPAVDDQLTGRENLDFHARMYGMNKMTRHSRMQGVLALVGLEDKADILLKNYSGGMKRRLEIARGLMHYPKVLFLDEPTLGLDPQTRYHIWEYIRNLNSKQQVTIILTTHYMEEADALCSRIAIIDYGKIRTVNTPDALKNSIGNDLLQIKASDLDLLAQELEKQEWVQGITRFDSCIYAGVRQGEEKIPLTINLAQSVGVRVTALSIRKPTLEDVFLHYTGKTIREEEVSNIDRIRARMRTNRRGGHS
jgi:ABC-2 type transport system ATP-binding protein